MKQVATIEANSALAQINTNINVGIDDLVNVFISRYESGLAKQRTSNQAIIKDLNAKIKVVTDKMLTDAKTWIGNRTIEGEVNNGVFTVFASVEKDSFKLMFESRVVQFNIKTKIRSNTSQDHYNKETSGNVYGEYHIPADQMHEYNELMAQKANVTAVLNQINTDLRNVSSKERQVRGQIAEQKLISQGMQDLINDPSILALIDTSTINVIE